ncbi:hypothetical protein RND71_030892 [Anisodus tanguticus]|uniref:Uncharacterized protein n=1 Tax=Anisodus tanguticus TaxID=243964 RepID=A0AAE1V7S4_9SOLA|nr:hypothetical protein RND71_030892 [Anisodus tanguticus]
MPNLGANNAATEANGSGRNGGSRLHRRRRRRPSMAACSETTTTDGSLHFTDSDSDQSWHSPIGSMDGISVNCEIDLESGELELMKLHNKEERDCRICHLSVEKWRD